MAQDRNTVGTGGRGPGTGVAPAPVRAPFTPGRRVGAVFQRRFPSHGLQTPVPGFTLIEILVVVVILGILAAVVVPNLMDQPDKAAATRARQDIQAIMTALDMYKLDNFTYPSTQQGLEALVRRPTGSPPAPNWKEGGYLRQADVPRDPWGNPYQYLSPGRNGPYEVYSLGADGQPGGDGRNADIGSWDLQKK